MILTSNRLENVHHRMLKGLGGLRTLWVYTHTHTCRAKCKFNHIITASVHALGLIHCRTVCARISVIEAFRTLLLFFVWLKKKKMLFLLCEQHAEEQQNQLREQQQLCRPELGAPPVALRQPDHLGQPRSVRHAALPLHAVSVRAPHSRAHSRYPFQHRVCPLSATFWPTPSTATVTWPGSATG